MQEEYNALMKNHTWKLVPMRTNRKLVGCKWVFKLKKNANWLISRYKAMLVAKGYDQFACFNYNETFSPVVKPTIIHVIIIVAFSQNWPLRQVNVNNAFLHSDLNETIFMYQPPCFESTSYSNPICHLNKALYGLKQAPRA